MVEARGGAVADEGEKNGVQESIRSSEQRVLGQVWFSSSLECNLAIE